MLIENPLGSPADRVLIEDEVVLRLASFRQLETGAHEAGGIFLGFRRGEHIHVVDATVPAPGDIRSPFTFIRQDPSHQTRATQGWERSNGRLDYLGDWHTHPEPKPSPSALDLREWRKLCCSHLNPMLFAILGTTDWWLGVGRGSHILRARGK